MSEIGGLWKHKQTQNALQLQVTGQAWELYAVWCKCAALFSPVWWTAFPSKPNPSWTSEIALFSNSQYLSFCVLWQIIKPSGSSGGYLQSEMHAWYTLRYVFMQECGTWPSGWTLFNVGDSFSDDGSRFRCIWEWVDKDSMEKGANKDGTVARTIRYGEWTPPLYAQIPFCNSHVWLAEG